MIELALPLLARVGPWAAYELTSVDALTPSLQESFTVKQIIRYHK